MGIFGVNMPLLYGEGDRAFIRLQEEILKGKWFFFLLYNYTLYALSVFSLHESACSEYGWVLKKAWQRPMTSPSSLGNVFWRILSGSSCAACWLPVPPSLRLLLR